MRFPPLFIPLAATLLAWPAMGATEVSRTPRPDWVMPAPGVATTVNEGDGESRYHLSDYQHHLEAEEEYTHLVISIINEAGVESFSQLDFEYIPDYQELQLHHITIERDGITQDRLTNAKIETLRREEGMEQQLYDGALTALVVLEDIRPGDVLSYAFTLKGDNPVFNGINHHFLKTAFSIPIDHVRRRIVWSPDNRTLKWQLHGGESQQPTEQTAGSLRELVWQKQQVARISPEEATPSWFNDYPELEYSDCPDWETFGRWAHTLYHRDEPLPADAAGICSEIRATHTTDAERIVAVLDWVQTNIRYLGSFFGEHTHEPYPLNDIWRRRFGDCKDKGMLTIAMLRHLGYDAAPAIVNSSLSHTIADYLPGPGTFNHFIVHLRWQDDDYFLDPTHTYQRGPLASRDHPDYGHVFIVRPESRQLTAVGRRGADIDKTVIRETYDVPTMKGDARLVVETTATGGDANFLRSYFASRSSDEIKDGYREFYANDFPEIEAAADVDIKDDPASNTIRVREQYRLPDFWTRSDERKRWESSINASFLRTSLRFPDKQARKHPYSHRHPVNIDQHIRINLPEPWSIEEEEITINHPAFDFQHATKRLPKGFTMDYSYRSLDKTVAAADFNRFTSSMDKLYDQLGMDIWHDDEDAATDTASDSSLGIIIGTSSTITGLFLGLLAAIGLWFWNPEPRQPSPVKPMTHVRGLGGWLVLPMIGIVISPFTLITLTATTFSTAIDMADTLNAETSIIGWRLYLASDLFINALMLPLSVLLAVVFFSKRTSAPWLYIGSGMLALACSLAQIAIESGLEDLEPGTGVATTLPRTVIATVVWCSYMLVSDRVKATFIVRRSQANAPAAVPPPIPATE